MVRQVWLDQARNRGAGLGKVWLGRYGAADRDMVRQGGYGLAGMARRGLARRGEMGKGMAGSVWHGKAGHGSVRTVRLGRLGGAWIGMDRNGRIRFGKAGKVRRGKLGSDKVRQGRFGNNKEQIMGKGSKPRPFSVDKTTFDSNWERIFGKANKSGAGNTAGAGEGPSDQQAQTEVGNNPGTDSEQKVDD